MDHGTFDRLTLRLGRLVTRRATISGLGLVALGIPSLAESKNKKRRKRRKRKKKVALNEFGCVNVGKFCKNDEQCCSGICEGKKDRKRCQAHDTGGCPAGLEDTFCSASTTEQHCITTTGNNGVCETTTGNGAYCLYGGNCFPCTKDADCQPYCGATAACVRCTVCGKEGGTMCAIAIGDDCVIP